jgi:MFS family permease
MYDFYRTTARTERTCASLITYYAPVIFQNSLGMSRDLALLLSGFNGEHETHSLISLILMKYSGLAYFFSSLVPIPLIERFGRRKLMLFGAAGQCVCMVLLAAMTQDPGNKVKGIIAAICLL